MREILAATADDKEEILKLYKMQLGRPFCPWDEYYPDVKEIDFDLSRQSMFVMWDYDEENLSGQSARIVAAISIDEDPMVEELDCWNDDLKPGAELARLAVHPDWQNKGIAREMIRFTMEVLKERGYISVHFLVNRLNIKALRSYAALQFKKVGECSLYDQPFWCYEKKI